MGKTINRLGIVSPRMVIGLNSMLILLPPLNYRTRCRCSAHYYAGKAVERKVTKSKLKWALLLGRSSFHVKMGLVASTW